RRRLMSLRSAAGESWRSVGRPDEGATGSVHFLVPVLVPVPEGDWHRLSCRFAQIARSSFGEMLDPRAVACIESRCTEYGASEVDGPPIGSRFGGGQSAGRTKAPPARCISWVGAFSYRGREINRPPP